MKKILSLVIALAMLLFCYTLIVLADTEQTTTQQKGDVWSGSVDTGWYDAKKTATSYTLSTVAELAGLASLVNEGTTFKGVRYEYNNESMVYCWTESYHHYEVNGYVKNLVGDKIYTEIDGIIWQIVLPDTQAKNVTLP